MHQTGGAERNNGFALERLSKTIWVLTQVWRRVHKVLQRSEKYHRREVDVIYNERER